MSPVRTATLRTASKLARVRSSSAVLPEPGELIRLMARTPAAWNRSRSSDASRSFSLRILRSSGSFICDLHVGEIELGAGGWQQVELYPAGQHFEAEAQGGCLD